MQSVQVRSKSKLLRSQPQSVHVNWNIFRLTELGNVLIHPERRMHPWQVNSSLLKDKLDLLCSVSAVEMIKILWCEVVSFQASLVLKSSGGRKCRHVCWASENFNSVRKEHVWKQNSSTLNSVPHQGKEFTTVQLRWSGRTALRLANDAAAVLIEAAQACPSSDTLAKWKEWAVSVNSRGDGYLGHSLT